MIIIHTKSVCSRVVHYIGEVKSLLRFLGVNRVGGLPRWHTAQSPAQGLAKLCCRWLLQTHTQTQKCKVKVYEKSVYRPTIVIHLLTQIWPMIQVYRYKQQLPQTEHGWQVFMQKWVCFLSVMLWDKCVCFPLVISLYACIEIFIASCPQEQVSVPAEEMIWLYLVRRVLSHSRVWSNQIKSNYTGLDTLVHQTLSSTRLQQTAKESSRVILHVKHRGSISVYISALSCSFKWNLTKKKDWLTQSIQYLIINVYKLYYIWLTRVSQQSNNLLAQLHISVDNFYWTLKMKMKNSR